MKKFILSLVLALSALLSHAQILVSGDITTNTTWTNNNIYILDGWVYVKAGATLTIEPGTLVKGDFTNKGALIIERDAMIMAEGTAEQPIIFTSQKAPGERSYGDWGGLIICGRAAVNTPANSGNGTDQGEAIIEGGVGSIYGGGTNPDNNDNSGVLRYVRIEYGGIPFQPNSEINGLTLGGVGAGTTIDHVQVSYCGDDAFEMFGGTVNLSNIIAYRNWDDDFDTDFGYQGHVQFALAVRDPLIADQSGSNGFESDNDATGTTNTPITRGIFSNVTIIGPQVNGTPASNYKRALHLRRNSQTSVFNSVFVGYPTGLLIEGGSTHTNATNGDLRFKNSVLAVMNDTLATVSTADPNNITGSFNITNWFNTGSFSNNSYNSVGELGFVDHSLSSPDLSLITTSPLLLGADFSDGYLGNDFFEVVAFRGAFGQDNWATCWTEWDPQTQPYNAAINNAITSDVVINSGNTMVCPGETIELEVTTNIDNPEIHWNNGDEGSTLTSAVPGTYEATIVAANGCSAQTESIVFGNYPTPVVSITALGNTSFCTGGSVVLEAEGDGTFEWSNEASGDQITVSETGSFSVTITDENSCQAVSNVINVNVSDSPVPTLTANGSTEVCDGATVVLSSSSADSYMWYLNGDVIEGADNQDFEATMAGAYTVVVTNSDACNGVGESAAVFVEVNPQPVADAQFNADPGSLEVQFINNSTLATGYLWDFGDGTTSTLANPVHTYTLGGNYDVVLTAYNGNCEDTFELSLLGVDIDEMQSPSSWTLYPNPACEQIVIAFQGAGLSRWNVSIFDMAGREIMSRTESSALIMLPVNELADGMYAAIVSLDGKQMQQFRFTVAH
ncbi:MAG: PKD domain-containing protein [Flavobacteriales bacterium]|nr:PKD domain-containing protein [Flavobacteriales bacterium]